MRRIVWRLGASGLLMVLCTGVAVADDSRPFVDWMAERLALPPATIATRIADDVQAESADAGVAAAPARRRLRTLLETAEPDEAGR